MVTIVDRGFTVWLTGLSGSGKTTLAYLVAQMLAGLGRRVEVLDGDTMRSSLCRDLDFSERDRKTNTERIGFVANMLARHGIAVVVAAIAPYRSARAAVRGAHDAAFVEVFVSCSLDELRRRDTKGLYRAAAIGALEGLTGVSAPYEAPETPDLILHTDRTSKEDCVLQLLQCLADLGLVEGDVCSNGRGRAAAGY